MAQRQFEELEAEIVASDARGNEAIELERRMVALLESIDARLARAETERSAP